MEVGGDIWKAMKKIKTHLEGSVSGGNQSTYANYAKCDKERGEVTLKKPLQPAS
jgi:hypothetical protein